MFRRALNQNMHFTWLMLMEFQEGNDAMRELENASRDKKIFCCWTFTTLLTSTWWNSPLKLLPKFRDFPLTILPSLNSPPLNSLTSTPKSFLLNDANKLSTESLSSTSLLALRAWCSLPRVGNDWWKLNAPGFEMGFQPLIRHGIHTKNTNKCPFISFATCWFLLYLNKLRIKLQPARDKIIFQFFVLTTKNSTLRVFAINVNAELKSEKTEPLNFAAQS